MQKEIKHIWYFKQSPEEVWDYLTKPELIEQWLMRNDFKPVEGHKFRFTFVSKNEGKYDNAVDCEVLQVKPFTTLSYSWNGHTKDKTRPYHSKVVWTLIPKDKGTELQLLHNGFTVLEDILTHTEGWKSCLTRFEGLINAVNKKTK